MRPPRPLHQPPLLYDDALPPEMLTVRGWFRQMRASKREEEVTIYFASGDWGEPFTVADFRSQLDYFKYFNMPPDQYGPRVVRVDWTKWRSKMLTGITE